MPGIVLTYPGLKPKVNAVGTVPVCLDNDTAHPGGVFSGATWQGKKSLALHGNLWDTDSFRLGYAEPPPSEREALARFAAKRLPLRGSWQPQAD